MTTESIVGDSTEDEKAGEALFHQHCPHSSWAMLGTSERMRWITMAVRLRQMTKDASALESHPNVSTRTV